MARPRLREDEAYLTIRLTKELKAQLEFESGQRDVSMNYLVVKAIRNLLYRDLIPINQLTKKEVENEQNEAGNLGGDGVFERYLHGSGMRTSGD